MLLQRLWPALAVLLAVLGTGADGARILVVAAITSKSHCMWNKALIEALADRGHQIDALVPYPGKNRTGLNYYDVGGQLPEDLDEDSHDFNTVGTFDNINIFNSYYLEISEIQATSPSVRQLLIEPQKLTQYDLFLYEACCSESLAGAFSKANIPIVAIDAYADASWNWNGMNVANYPSVYHQPVFPYRTQMSFWERTNSFLYDLYNKFSRCFYLSAQQEIAKKMFGEGAADLKELETSRFDMLMMNSGMIGLDLSRTLPPNVKEVGCLHCRPANNSNLPKDIKDFLDGASDGFVYFSLGSYIRSSTLPKDLVQGILSVFKDLKPLKVLWKFEKDLPGKPDNVKISKWLPQQDVLGHKNIRLFISHGGRLSLQESIYHGAPVFAIPFFADQFLNGERMVENGMGMRMNFQDFDITVFKNNVDTMLEENKRFMAAAKRLSALARDQPETPLQRAVFWVEYVIRHNGAKHLKPPGAHLNWFQLHSLDIISVLLLVALTPIALVFIICKSTKKTPGKNTEKKNK